MHLIQVTDCHLMADPAYVGYGQIAPYKSLQQVLSRVAALAPDRVLLTGDLSGDATPASYQLLDSLLQEQALTDNVVMIPGNHDDPALMRRFFPEAMSWQSQPLSADDWLVHGLNSYYRGTLGRVDRAQLEILMNRVEVAPEKAHAVVVHHHPIEVNGWMDRHQWVNRQEFLDVIRGCAPIKLVLYGHIHSALETQLVQTQFLSCPATCWQWQHSADFAVADQMPGFRELQLKPDGTVTSVVHRLDGV